VKPTPMVAGRVVPIRVGCVNSSIRLQQRLHRVVPPLRASTAPTQRLCDPQDPTEREARRRFGMRMCCHARALRNGADCCVRWAAIRKGEAATRDRLRACTCAQSLSAAASSSRCASAAPSQPTELSSAPPPSHRTPKRGPHRTAAAPP
jgi:hypothetical protein